MKTIILCPECGELAHYNSYFGAYLCSKCKWEDRSPGQRRMAVEAILSRLRCGEKVTRADLKTLLRDHVEV